LVKGIILEKHAVSIFGPEDGGSTLLRNIGFYHPVHTALEPRRSYVLKMGVFWVVAPCRLV
jgi:hypothetical protein